MNILRPLTAAGICCLVGLCLLVPTATPAHAAPLRVETAAAADSTLAAPRAAESLTPKTGNPEQRKPPVSDRKADAQPALEQLFSGSAIGALFLGYPYTGMGFADILALTLLLYGGLKTLLAVSRRPRGGSPAGAGASAPPTGPVTRPLVPERRWYAERKSPSTVKEQAASAWEHLRGAPTSGHRGVAVNPAAAVPADFDARDFLDGARTAYSRLQISWAARDVDDITPFVTPDMLETVKEQAGNDPRPRRTEIVVVHATLTGVTRTADEERATVLFDGLLREEDRTGPIEAREIWHFTRNLHAEGMWRLDAIEAVRNGNDDGAA